MLTREQAIELFLAELDRQGYKGREYDTLAARGRKFAGAKMLLYRE
jgi:hypothetical protein